MSIFASPRFLRNVLFADAASCVASGAVQLLFTPPLVQLMNLPSGLLAETGWFLLAYAAVVGFIAMRDPLPRALIGLLVAGNLGWAAGCVLLLLSGWIAPTLWGQTWVLAQAATVAVLAELQWVGLKRSRPAAWA